MDTKQSQKNRRWMRCGMGALGAVLLCVLIGWALTRCGAFGPGAGDWSYALPNGYAIWRINSQSIVCGKEEKAEGGGAVLSEQVGGDYIVQFCVAESFVCLQSVDPPQRELVESIDTSHPDYYILNTQTGESFGPLTEAEFRQKTEALGLGELSVWTATKPTPQGVQWR